MNSLVLRFGISCNEFTKPDLNFNTDWSILCLLSFKCKKQASYWKQQTKIPPLVAWHPVSSVCPSHQTERWWLWWRSPVSQSGCGGTGYWPAWQDHLCNTIGLIKVWYFGLIFIHWKPDFFPIESIHDISCSS